MSAAKVQDCIDSAGRLAGYLSDLWGDITLADVLTLCAEANVALSRDTALAAQAIGALSE